MSRTLIRTYVHLAHIPVHMCISKTDVRVCVCTPPSKEDTYLPLDIYI